MNAEVALLRQKGLDFIKRGERLLMLATEAEQLIGEDETPPDSTVAGFAFQALAEHGSLDKKRLFEIVCRQGGSVATVASLVSILSQDRQKRFLPDGRGNWSLRST